MELPVDERIPDAITALRCLAALVDSTKFDSESKIFEEDLRYSLRLLKRLNNTK